MPYGAIQVFKGETPHSVFDEYFRIIAKAGSKFKYLETLGPLDLGKAQFIRFRTDCAKVFHQFALHRMNRGGVIEEDGIYTVSYEGWSGPVSAAGMQAVARPGLAKKYRGPGKPFWERQWLKSSTKVGH